MRHEITKAELNLITDCIEFRASAIIKQITTLHECGVTDLKKYEKQAEQCFRLAEKLKIDY